MKYVQMYKIGDGEYASVDSPGSTGYPGLVKTYEVKDDGSLVEYVKPERMFALQTVSGEIDVPNRQSAFEFYITNRPYFEVMPDTGDYRRISEEERAQLEAEA